MNKLDKIKKTPKTYLNSTSHISHLTSNKGITLTSLVIYIAVMFVVLATIMRVMTYFRKNMTEAADVTFETQIEKLNLYFLEETKKVGNDATVSENGYEIIFTSGNKYTYDLDDKILYLNDSIKICENIDTCHFLQDKETAENKKTILEVEITMGEKNKILQYVMTSEMQQGEIINEEDYILNRVEENVIKE